MNARDENPYAALNVAELPATTDVPLELPGLPKFLLQGLYAALLTAPFNAAYFGVIQLMGLPVTISFMGHVGYSIVGTAIAALGDGLTAMLCWRIVKNEPRSLTLFAAGMGTRILAILCQGVMATGLHWNFSTLPRFMIFGLCYGLPSLFLTVVFLRLLNRGVSLWVYPTVFIAASAGGYVLNLTIFVIYFEGTTKLFGLLGLARAIPHGIFVNLATDVLFLCVLAAILWFGVRVSRPTLNPIAARP